LSDHYRGNEMTVSNSTSRVQYNGDGSTTEFAIPFYFIQNADIEVIPTTAGVEGAPLTLGTDYTLTGAGDTDGGTLTTIATYTSATTLTIQRSIALTQSTDYEPYSKIPADTLERDVDRLTMQVQQMQQQINRAYLLPAGSTSLNKSIATPVSGEYPRWDSNGNLIAGGSAAVDLGNYTYSDANAVQRTVLNRLTDYVSVKDFGAVGDGVTDDTAAIQNALDVASSSTTNGVVIYFPRGKYLVSNLTLSAQFGITLMGDCTSQLACIKVTGKISCNNVGNFKVYGLAFVGADWDLSTNSRITGTPTAGNHLFEMVGCPFWVVRDCYFEAFDICFNAITTTSYVIDIESNYFNWCNKDVYLGAALHWTIANNTFSETLQYNLHWVSGQEIRYTGNKHENSTNAMSAAHVYIGDGVSTVVTTGVISENTFHQFYGFYFNKARQLTVANNAVRLPKSDDSITCNGCSEIIIEGNQMYGYDGSTYRNNGLVIQNANSVHQVTGNIFRDYANCVLLQGNSQAVNLQGNTFIGQTSSITVYTNTATDQIVSFEQNTIQGAIISGDGASNDNTTEWLLRNNIRISATITNNDNKAIEWYKEGTWTPADGSGAGLSFSSVSAKYVKNGNQVTASFNLTYPSTADGTAAKISGLPFTASSDTLDFGFIGFSQATRNFGLNVNGGTDDITFTRIENDESTTGGTSITNANLSGVILRCTVIYTI